MSSNKALSQNYQLISRFKLTDDEINFLISTIALIKKEDPDFKKYIIPLQELNGDYLEIKQLARQLISKPFEIENDGYFLIFNWFETIEIENNFFKTSISNELKPFLLELKSNFKSYELSYAMRLSSEYAVEIYHILTKHKDIGNKIFSVADMQEMLNVPKSLLVYADFKRKIINLSVEQINKHTDLEISFSEIKSGRKITDINFIINIKTERGVKEKDLFKVMNIRENDNPQNIPIFQEQTPTKTPEENQPKELTLIEKADKLKHITNEKQLSYSQKIEKASEQNLEIKRIVTFFDHERRNLQPNYVRREYRSTDGEYLLRIHMNETGRTPAMFYDAIRWLFSNNPKAGFHRQYIMNIGKLIEHFNVLEHQAMFSKEAVKFNEEAQTWANIYKKQGMSDNEILNELKKGGYIQ